MAQVHARASVPGVSQAELFDWSQDFGRRHEWGPIPDVRVFHGEGPHPSVGSELTMRAKNGFVMRVRYVTHSPPDMTTIEVVQGISLFRRFAWSWRFQPDACGGTSVIFSYHFAVSRRWLPWITGPWLRWFLQRLAKRRVQALAAWAMQRASAEVSA